jgi:hypothetical protein
MHAHDRLLPLRREYVVCVHAYTGSHTAVVQCSRPLHALTFPRLGCCCDTGIFLHVLTFSSPVTDVAHESSCTHSHPQDCVAAAAQGRGHPARRPAVAPVRNVDLVIPPWISWLLRSFLHLPVVLLLPQPPATNNKALSWHNQASPSTTNNNTLLCHNQVSCYGP